MPSGEPVHTCECSQREGGGDSRRRDRPPAVSCLYSVMSRLSAVAFPDARDAIANGVCVLSVNVRDEDREVSECDGREEKMVNAAEPGRLDSLVLVQLSVHPGSVQTGYYESTQRSADHGSYEPFIELQRRKVSIPASDYNHTISSNSVVAIHRQVVITEGRTLR